MRLIRVSLRSSLWLGLALLISSVLSVSGAQQKITGPVRAIVEKVVDGDTLSVRAQIWLGQEINTLVRLTGVDTPELHGACKIEHELALRARSLVVAFVGNGGVLLLDINQDKYGGRVLARVSDTEGVDLADTLIEAGLARAYDGRSPRSDWCGAHSFSENPP